MCARQQPTGDDPAPNLRFDEPAGRWVLFATVVGSGVIFFLTTTIVNVALTAMAVVGALIAWMSIRDEVLADET